MPHSCSTRVNILQLDSHSIQLNLARPFRAQESANCLGAASARTFCNLAVFFWVALLCTAFTLFFPVAQSRYVYFTPTDRPHMCLAFFFPPPFAGGVPLLLLLLQQKKIARARRSPSIRNEHSRLSEGTKGKGKPFTAPPPPSTLSVFSVTCRGGGEMEQLI